MSEDLEHNDPAGGLPAGSQEAHPEPESAPEPVTPPQGVTPAGDAGPESTPPQGTYALGALSGHPMLGQDRHSPLGPHDTDPGGPAWPAPPAPGAGATDNTHAMRNGLLAGIAGVAILAAGVGLGHAAWNNGSNGNNTQAFAPSSGSSRLPSGSGGSGSGSPFGDGSPFGGGGFGDFGNSGTGNSGNTGNTGNSGNSNSGSSNSSGPSNVDAIASKVDPGLVDINTSLGYQQVQAAGTGIVLTSNGVILTNNHVIDGATNISVTDVGNQKTYTASVVGYDRSQDIAVLQLHNASGLQTATLGNSSDASVGEDVVG
ncbi:MAG: trypsin-like peptidase domain-containing protein, partial [Acidimicrobiales bacterium]|nr:trypsin-like peptidase domain-containing protein [Acidimicrobiales bacterium]